jgi:hypothetical protein
MQDPSKPLPDIGLKEKDFPNRKAFLNARARAAGYKNYYQWLKARREAGVPKKNKGGRKPGAKQYSWAIAIKYTNYAVEGGKVEYNNDIDIFAQLPYDDLIKIVKDTFEDMDQEETKSYIIGSIAEVSGKKEAVEASYITGDWILIGLKRGRTVPLAGLVVLMQDYKIDNYTDLIGDLIAKGYKELEDLLNG